MFNLLRMDLYRAVRGKSLYVCFGILLFATALSFGLWFLVATPQGRELSVWLLGENVMLERSADMLDGVDFLMLFRQICLNGGMYNLLFGIWVMLFVCTDFQSGFVKNVMALYQNRWNYIGSKVLTIAIVNGCYLALNLISALLLNQILGKVVPNTGWQAIVFYMSWIWLVTTAFGALILLVCILTRSVAAGAVAAVLLSSGTLVVLLYGFLNMFQIGDWLEYTIYLTMAVGPGQYNRAGDLYVYAVGAGFLAVYTAIAGLILRKKDI